MKAAITLTLIAGMLWLCGVAPSSTAWAQARPEAGRGAEAGSPGLRGQPGERLPAPQRPEEQAPGEDGPSAQDEPPAAPACQDGGRKLELIV